MRIDPKKVSLQQKMDKECRKLKCLAFELNSSNSLVFKPRGCEFEPHPMQAWICFSLSIILMHFSKNFENNCKLQNFKNG